MNIDNCIYQDFFEGKIKNTVIIHNNINKTKQLSSLKLIKKIVLIVFIKNFYLIIKREKSQY